VKTIESFNELPKGRFGFLQKVKFFKIKGIQNGYIGH